MSLRSPTGYCILKGEAGQKSLSYIFMRGIFFSCPPSSLEPSNPLKLSHRRCPDVWRAEFRKDTPAAQTSGRINPRVREPRGVFIPRGKPRVSPFGAHSPARQYQGSFAEPPSLKEFDAREMLIWITGEGGVVPLLLCDHNPLKWCRLRRHPERGSMSPFFPRTQ